MQTVLNIENLTVTYARGLKAAAPALDNVCLKVESGTVLGLLGPNGAGKTTLIKAALGLIGIKTGSISLFGSPLSRAALSRVGYMPEAASFYWFFTPREVLRMLGSLSGLGGAALSARIDAVLDAVELSDNADKLIKKFSKGMASRLNAAQAMLHDPEFLILDEPFSGLDPLARIQMRNLLAGLKKGGKTVLLSSHELSEAELICDDICVMKSGGIIKEGPIGAMLKDRSGQSLEKYFMEIISA